MLFIGPEAERRFGHRHFMAMTAVFTAAPEFTVLSGRAEIGRISPDLLTEEVPGPRLLLLGGRSWRVTYIDWARRRCFVEPADRGGKARWSSLGRTGTSCALARGIRDVLLGADVPVRLTRRAEDKLAEMREEHIGAVHPGGTLIVRESSTDVRWWTWAGHRTNATLIATLGHLADPTQRVEEFAIRLREDLTVDMWRSATADLTDRVCLPDVNPKAVAGLKFNTALPERLAVTTLAARLADTEGALAVLGEPIRIVLR
jgi:ATP-dependent Lhr-like helicase